MLQELRTDHLGIAHEAERRFCILLALGVDRGKESDLVEHGVEFAGADALFGKVHGLVADAALLEPPLRLLAVEVLLAHEDLDVHVRFPPWR